MRMSKGQRFTFTSSFLLCKRSKKSFDSFSTNVIHPWPIPRIGFPSQANRYRSAFFGQATVSLDWDDEYADRCFLKVSNPSGTTGFQLTLWGEEIKHLTEALRQVKQDLEEDRLL